MAQQITIWSHLHNQSAYSPEWKKAPKCTWGIITVPKHCSRHFLHSVNQCTLTTVHHNVMWSIWYKLCQYRQHGTSDIHKIELLENSLVVDPIKGRAEINLQARSCPLSTALCRVSDTHKSASQVPRPYRKANWVVGSMHTTAFRKSSETNRQQTLKHFRQNWCHGNLWVMATEEEFWTVRNWGDINLSPASREISQTNKLPNTTVRRGQKHQQFSYEKEETYPPWPSVLCTAIRVQV